MDRFDRSPFLLGYSGKSGNHFDFFLNVLLFVPFGVGVAAQARKRSVERRTAFFLALAAGAFVSYSVEFLQLYLAELGSWVTITQGIIFVVCVLAFRRGIIGEIEAFLRGRRA